jgi:hypothetical protein
LAKARATKPPGRSAASARSIVTAPAPASRSRATNCAASAAVATRATIHGTGPAMRSRRSYAVSESAAAIGASHVSMGAATSVPASRYEPGMAVLGGRVIATT